MENSLSVPPRRSVPPSGRSQISSIFHETFSPLNEHPSERNLDRGSPNVYQKLLNTIEKHSVPPTSPSTKLRRSGSTIFLVLLYAVLAIFAWVIICILNYRPLTTAHYGLYISPGDSDVYDTSDAHTLYVKNETWLRAARVIQSIVSIFNNPAHICSVLPSSGRLHAAEREKRQSDPQVASSACRQGMATDGDLR